MFDLPIPPDPPPTEIVITAKPLSDPASARAYDLDVIDEASLANAPSGQLDEVLKQIPGLQMFRRSDARSSHPTSQGVTLRALGGNASSRALLILDGIPQADPFGGWVNWPAYDPASLSEVQVIRGGGSVAHGPGALAGVISMTSNLSPGVAVQATGGSRSSFEGQMRAATRLGSGLIGLSIGAAGGRGFIPITKETRGPADRPAGYGEGNARAFWLTPLARGVDLQVGASAFIDRRERGLKFTGNRTKGSDASLRLIGRGTWAWTAAGYIQLRELKSSFASVNADRTVAARVSLQDEVPSRAYGGSFELRPPLSEQVELRLGGDMRLATGQSNELFGYVDGLPTRRRKAGGDLLTGGAFGELTWHLGRLTLSGGGRIDHWRISDGMLREWTLADGTILRDDRYQDRNGWLPTARAGAVADLGEGTSIRSATYLGWRPATLNELFRPFRAGPDATAANPRLVPERLAGVEAGIDHRRPNLMLSATLFWNRLRDGIANVTLGHGPGVFPGVGFVGPSGEFRQRRNIDAILSRGVEFSAELRHGDWSMGTGFSLVEADVDGSGPAVPLDGLRPAQTPAFTFIGKLGWDQGDRSASLMVRYVGAQFEDDLNRRRLPPAATIDGFVAWPVAAGLQLVVRGENLLNKRVLAGLAADGSAERATPRTLWLGLRFGRPGRITGSQ